MKQMMKQILKDGIQTILTMVVFLSVTVNAQTWTAQSSGVFDQLKSVYFTSETEGWICGDNGALLHTVDAGLSWTKVTVFGGDLHEVVFYDAQIGIVSGDGGTILRTTNGGASWSVLNSGTASQLRGCSFGANGVAWAAGRDGALVKSTDVGATWAVQNSGTTTRIRSVYGVGATNAWVVGEDGLIRHTTDGSAWSLQTSPVADNLEDVQFLNESVGYISGSGTVLYTDNGGASWAMRGTGVAGETNGLYFSDSNTGWVVNESGQIFHTLNAGLNWVVQTTGISGILNDVFVTSGGAGWAVGDNGVILHQAPLTGIEDAPSSISRNIELYQNYPNPFNPSTTIEFQLGSHSNVMLSVYNIAGQKVADVLNRPMAAGAHTVTFAAGNLPTGVYFYELRSGNTKEIRKMMLMK